MEPIIEINWPQLHKSIEEMNEMEREIRRTNRARKIFNYSLATVLVATSAAGIYMKHQENNNA